MSSCIQWKAYRPTKKVGKLCCLYCSKHSYLPIRDVLNGHGEGFKVEPNYETATYNWCAKCNQPSVNVAVRDRLSHILFITKYTGSKRKYMGRYFIVGYYQIGWVRTIDGRTAIRAKEMCFVPVEKAYEIKDERWMRINTNGKTKSLTNLRHATQRIRGDLLEEILNHLHRHNAVDDYLREVACLKANHNPFIGEIPNGRIFIINVGANSNSPLQSPLFTDNRFEFVPIPEVRFPNGKFFSTYAELRKFNEPKKLLLDLFSKPSIDPQVKVHDDPEFLTFTYGDNTRKKRNLKDLQEGDFLFFLARLVSFDGQFKHNKAIFALVGYFEISEWVENLENPIGTVYNRNAHVARWMVDPKTFEGFTIFKGSHNSRRFRFAVPFDRTLVEDVPILTAGGNEWNWGWTTELGVIGSYTRTPRMFIDPNTIEGKQQAEQFWMNVWRGQDWRLA